MCLQIQLVIYIGHARNAAVGDSLANILIAQGTMSLVNTILTMQGIKLLI